MTCEPEASSPGSEGSTLPSMLPSALSLLGSANQTLTVDGCSSGTGPEFLSSTMCGRSTPPLLPTPQKSDGDGGRITGNVETLITGRRPSGSKASIPLATAIAWMSSTAATPVSRSRSPGNGRARTTPGTCGRSSRDSFAYYDPEQSCWRTSQATLLSDSTESSLTLPKWGTTVGGDAFELPTPAPLTGASGCSSLLRTPYAGSPNSQRGRPQGAAIRAAQGHTVSLGDQIVDLLPTPSANDHTVGGSEESATADHGGELRAALVHGPTRRLLPTPRAQNGEPRNSKVWARPLNEPQNIENALARLPGAHTSPPSDAGKPSEATTHPGQLTIGDA